MKRLIYIVALLATTLCGSQTVLAETNEVATIQRASICNCGNPSCKGLLAEEYVDISQDRFTITISAPMETVIGVAPNFQWSYNNMDRTLTITGSLHTLNLRYVGQEALFEVAVNGGFYHVLLIGR